MHDLERSQERVTEQEEDLKSLSRLLQLEQQQAKDLSEHALIKEAEVRNDSDYRFNYPLSSFIFIL